MTETTACPGSTATVDLDFTSNDVDVSALSVDITYDSSILSNPTLTLPAVGQCEYYAVDSDTFRFVQLSSLSDGTVAQITFDVDPYVAVGDSTTLSIEVSCSDQDGYDVYIEGISGRITFGSCCIGDCNGDGHVSIAEVQSAINQFLGLSTAAMCNDQNGNGAISISEVQTIINNYLKGC
ncbi:MAG: hypothetical protein JRG68_09990 [Deltaproteobacteria bacterium]|nr:hypothetical protein [Deltaproteobacteria bacterium]